MKKVQNLKAGLGATIKHDDKLSDRISLAEVTDTLLNRFF